MDKRIAELTKKIERVKEHKVVSVLNVEGETRVIYRNDLGQFRVQALVEDDPTAPYAETYYAQKVTTDLRVMTEDMMRDIHACFD